VIAVLLTYPAQAADTVETWDVGATDVDFYLGFDGMGLDRYERTLSGEIMLGYNVTLIRNGAFELITQVYFDIPQTSGEDFAVGVSVGFIVTLPAVDAAG
jgi:hypothetical protein